MMDDYETKAEEEAAFDAEMMASFAKGRAEEAETKAEADREAEYRTAVYATWGDEE